ncbi:MAG: hypothetical protein KME27_07275 [Lyngbya sp. HA4199-MV5]|jgi:hypothetical protein|nr:hypothetical protein [Lyngbya sp. HA4199-MV5]
MSIAPQLPDASIVWFRYTQAVNGFLGEWVLLRMSASLTNVTSSDPDEIALCK